jgi:hypothetical protein
LTCCGPTKPLYKTTTTTTKKKKKKKKEKEKTKKMTTKKTAKMKKKNDKTKMTTRQRQLHYSYTHMHSMSHFTDFTKIRSKRARDRPQTTPSDYSGHGRKNGKERKKKGRKNER